MHIEKDGMGTVLCKYTIYWWFLFLFVTAFRTPECSKRGNDIFMFFSRHCIITARTGHSMIIIIIKGINRRRRRFMAFGRLYATHAICVVICGVYRCETFCIFMFFISENTAIAVDSVNCCHAIFWFFKCMIVHYSPSGRSLNFLR